VSGWGRRRSARSAWLISATVAPGGTSRMAQRSGCLVVMVDEVRRGRAGRGPGRKGPGPRREEGPRLAREKDAVRARAARSMRQTPQGGTCGRGEQSPRESRFTLGRSPAFLSLVGGCLGGGERCRAHPPTPGCRGRCVTRPERGGRRRRVPVGRGGTCARWPRGAIGGVGHSVAMIASNSARSRSSSAQTMSRNGSSTDGPMPASGTAWLGMTVLPSQALMACRSSPLLVTEILRGLACSATGICRVSTPAS